MYYIYPSKRERTGEHLDWWLEAVKASQFEAFESFSPYILVGSAAGTSTTSTP